MVKGKVSLRNFLLMVLAGLPVQVAVAGAKALHNQELEIAAKVEAARQNRVKMEEVLDEEFADCIRQASDILREEKEDYLLLAKMVYGEARGCANREKIAVAHTPLNRLDKKLRYGKTLRQVLLKPWQYSCFNENDPNRKKLEDPAIYSRAGFKLCLRITDDVLLGKHPDPTNGATHYFNPDVVKPSWARKMTKIGKIPTERGFSEHEFYRED